MKLVECVPNFSEGKDPKIIQAITDEIQAQEGVTLLDVDAGAATNRVVVTFIGPPEAVKEAAFKAIKKAGELIDMERHKGEHPRMGATDVCPFVPVAEVSMEECVNLANELGQRVGEELKIPVYLYEYAAKTPLRKNLADIRKGEYEGLPEKLKDPLWKPDFGPAKFVPKSGATVIGAREFLIAYNVNLNTKDPKLAHEIALRIREKGRIKRDAQGKRVRDENGKLVRIPGTLKAVKARGWYIPEYNCAQVTMNLVNYKITPIHIAFEEICKQAQDLGLIVTGSEIVGMVPKSAILEAGRHFLLKQKKSIGVPEEELIDIAIKSLGLNQVSEFIPEKKIIEYRLAAQKTKLIKKNVREFLNELSTDSPAPGGGSTAALAGSLAASLASMVSNLTIPKKGYEGVRDEMEEIAIRAQELKDKFLEAIDRDNEAFLEVMKCMRLPKKTEEQKKEKDLALKKALKEATLVPYEVMEMGKEALELTKEVVKKGLETSLSDAGVGALMAEAAITAAFFNVMINLPSIQDEKFKQEMKEKAKKIYQYSSSLGSDIKKIVIERLL
jgi:glutamate formiminotransferase/formiminotetrahydrofolate cyclodeaminase